MTWFDITPFFYFLYNSYLLSNYKYLIYKAKLFILKRKFLPIKKVKFISAMLFIYANLNMLSNVKRTH